MKRKEGEREESKHKTNPFTLGNGKYKNRTCTWENTNQSPHLICIFYVEGKQFLLATLLDVDGVCSAHNVSYIRRQLKSNNTLHQIKNRKEKKKWRKNNKQFLFKFEAYQTFYNATPVKKSTQPGTHNWQLNIILCFLPLLLKTIFICIIIICKGAACYTKKEHTRPRVDNSHSSEKRSELRWNSQGGKK